VPRGAATLLLKLLTGQAAAVGSPSAPLMIGTGVVVEPAPGVPLPVVVVAVPVALVVVVVVVVVSPA